MKVIFCITILLCPYLTNAQQSLAIGDQLPQHAMITLQAAISQQKQSPATTTQSRPGLYLLDFWATWCGVCRKNMPHLAALQSKYGADLQPVLINPAVTGDNAQQVHAFFKKFYAANPSAPRLASIAQDSLFAKLFPFQAFPHYAWISAAGKVLAITGSEEVTPSNIDKALKGEPLPLANRAAIKPVEAGMSIFFDQENKETLAVTGAGMADTASHSILPGLVKFKSKSYQTQVATGQPLLSLYQRALSFKANRIRLQLPDDHPILKAKINAELIAPADCTDEEFRAAWISLLNQSFNLDGRMQTIEANCYLLQVVDTARFNRMQQTITAATKAGKDSMLYKNKTPLFITNTINSSLLANRHWPIIISEASFTQPISLALPNHSLKNNLPGLQAALLPWGLCLLETRRPLSCFVLEQVAPTSITKQNCLQ
ncbi:MAG: TlpA family protein disulfide reductase [Chitinophagaceae bacterium]|nr:MAG: TlpA family protein disulfide reductase [Chitinophagaceae bacterium]